MDIHYLDISMVNISIGLFQDIIVDSLIGNIRVSMTKSDMQQLQMKFTPW